MYLYLNNTEALVNLPVAIKRHLLDETNLTHLSNKLCPFELVDGSVVIGTLDAYKDSDQLVALESWLSQQNKRLGIPCRWVLPPTLLLALVKNQVVWDSLKTNKRYSLDGGRTGLAQAFQEMIEWAVVHHASDLHITINQQKQVVDIRYSIAGRYIAPERFKNMPISTMMDILSVAWMDIQGGNGAVFDPNIEQQGRLYREINMQSLMLRWASIATDQGPSVCFRILHLDGMSQEQSFTEMGYLPSQVEMLEQAQMSEGGAIVLAGVVGSGKSTTIARLLANIPSNRKIMTLEDPVEYLIPNALQNSVTRLLDGSSVSAFDAKLKTVKRSAMHDLLIGEIRDQETGRAFMDLAGSGSNIYTTVHAGSAMLIVERLNSEFIGIPRDFLTTPGILKLLVFQSLLPVLCPHCSIPIKSSSPGMLNALGKAMDKRGYNQYLNTLETHLLLDLNQIRVRNDSGCDHCCNPDMPALNGWVGRTVVAEMLMPQYDLELLSYLKSNHAIHAYQYLNAKPRTALNDIDMTNKSAFECAIYKVSQGLIDPREVEIRFQSFTRLTESITKAPNQ